jgi:ParB-like chromosome segregation protein Spo0J
MISDELKNAVKTAALNSDDVTDFLEDLKQFLHEEVSEIAQPIDRVRWVSVDKVSANDYNPNSVAKTEMRLLYTSILHDGYTQPVVTVYDEDNDRYVIVDGFHRYLTCKSHDDIRERNHGRLPVVVINKDINDRMASTIRHNRARGKHSIQGMSSIVFSMLDEGWDDAHICNELGMEPEELVRLKHVTGFSKLFKDAEYSRAWMKKKQIKLRKEYADSQQKAD